MEFNIFDTHDWIVEELATVDPIGECMRRLIDRCAKSLPHRGWDKLRQLHYDDVASLRSWIECVLVNEPPTSDLRGLWFGIFNPQYGGRPTADFYVSGSDRFDGKSESNDWACGPTWWPDGRYARSEILDSIYRIAYNGRDGLGNDAEYPLCLGYTALVVRDLLNNLDPRIVLNSVGPVGVAVGFDSGDFIVLGRYTREGLGPV